MNVVRGLVIVPKHCVVICIYICKYKHTKMAVDWIFAKLSMTFHGLQEQQDDVM